MTTVDYSTGLHHAVIALNRPDKLNAINQPMIAKLNEALVKAQADPEVRVVLLKGHGRAFCAGDDLDELETETANNTDLSQFAHDLQQVTRHIMLGSKIILCAVQGWAIGGGASWPLNADFSLWSDDAKVKFPEARHGLFPSGGATWLLPQFCGPQRAQQIMLFGDSLSAEQIVTDRIAQDLVPAERLEAAAEDMVKRLLELPAASLTRYKAERVALIRDPLEMALRVETKILVECAQSFNAAS